MREEELYAMTIDELRKLNQLVASVLFQRENPYNPESEDGIA